MRDLAFLIAVILLYLALILAAVAPGSSPDGAERVRAPWEVGR